jgi:hypothetical protein
MSERETVVELPWAADSCPCVEKLRTVLPLTVGIRDGEHEHGTHTALRLLPDTLPDSSRSRLRNAACSLGLSLCRRASCSLVCTP